MWRGNMSAKLCLLVGFTYLCSGFPAPQNPGGENFCAVRNDGIYANPVNRHSFIQCSHRTTFVLNCSAALCFDASISQCNYCQEDTPLPRTTSDTTFKRTMTGTTSVPKISAKPSPRATIPITSPRDIKDFCRQRNNGNYQHPEDKHSFIQCSYGIAYVSKCPASLCYDASLAICNYCDAATPLPPSVPSTPLTPKLAKSSSDIEDFCRQRRNGTYANPKDKHSFVQCSYGIAYVRPCSASLCFDASKVQCDYCKKPTSLPPSTPTKPASSFPTMAPSTMSPNFDPFCIRRKDGTYPIPENKNSFIQCSKGIAYVGTCSASKCFDAYKGLCGDCEEITSLPPSTPTRQPPAMAPTTSPSDTGSFCSQRNNGNYSNPENKRSYILCSWGIAHVRTCSASLCFDASQGRCGSCKETTSHPSSNAPIPTKSSTSLPSSKASVTPLKSSTLSSGFCKGRANGQYAHQESRRQFVTCSNSDTFILMCPSSLCYDEQTNSCQYCA